MSISKKLLGAFFSLIVITMSLGAYTVWSVTHMGNIAFEIYDKGLMSVNFARAAALDMERARALLTQSGLVGTDLYVDVTDTQQGVMSADPIVTGSVSDRSDLSAGSPVIVSERHRLLELAGTTGTSTERQRLVAIARSQSGEASTRTSVSSRGLTERGRLVQLARAKAEPTERRRLVAIANLNSMVMAQAEPSTEPVDASTGAGAVETAAE